MVYHRFIENLWAIYCTGIIMPRVRWKHIAIPLVLYNEIDRVIRHYGRWASVSDFVRDAVRKRLEEVWRLES